MAWNRWQIVRTRPAPARPTAGRRSAKPMTASPFFVQNNPAGEPTRKDTGKRIELRQSMALVA